MRTAGIIGGMGPGTTADFYRDINEISEKAGYDTRPELLIWNIPLDYEVEQELLVHQRGIEKYLPPIVRGAQKLEKAGSDFLVVPCNTVHELYDQFSSEVEIPFLHIVNETVSELQRRDIGSVALLATGQTIKSGLYQNFLEKAGIDCTVPEDRDQKHLNSLVADLVTAEGVTENEYEEQRWLNRLIDDYTKKIGSVVLGCTDFHIMLKERDHDRVIDSMQVLAHATVTNIYAKEHEGFFKAESNT